MNETEKRIKEPGRFLGPWVIMVILPWLFPVVLIALVISAAIKESIQPFRKLHYWLVFSLIGLAVYSGIEMWLSFSLQEAIRSYSS